METEYITLCHIIMFMDDDSVVMLPYQCCKEYYEEDKETINIEYGIFGGNDKKVSNYLECFMQSDNTSGFFYERFPRTIIVVPTEYANNMLYSMKTGFQYYLDKMGA